MKQDRTVEDVYLALDELAAELKASGDSRLGEIVHHRLHQVAWTTGSELLEELHVILTSALQRRSAEMSLNAKKQIEQILLVIGSYLVDRKA